MERFARRITTGLAAAGIATILFAAPAQAKATDPEGGGWTGTACAATPASTTSEATPWLKIALGAAGGIALAGATTATVTSRRRHQHPGRLTPAA